MLSLFVVVCDNVTSNGMSYASSAHIYLTPRAQKWPSNGHMFPARSFGRSSFGRRCDLLVLDSLDTDVTTEPPFVDPVTEPEESIPPFEDLDLKSALDEGRITNTEIRLLIDEYYRLLDRRAAPREFRMWFAAVRRSYAPKLLGHVQCVEEVHFFIGGQQFAANAGTVNASSEDCLPCRK
ncbi:hypothetical protein LSH36_683g02067 [Paralvinella palmiformis]|uniref:Uncharacterized protein n=1 Tax=Paralvinella palmiformis TaxID=53620 RepID=A0AAD9J2J8_9ANNE|nr:hypothetical protein LSH36_683g02067 [Paralvinella palmiformis]